jgi:hypothetical protein
MWSNSAEHLGADPAAGQHQVRVPARGDRVRRPGDDPGGGRLREQVTVGMDENLGCAHCVSP